MNQEEINLVMTLVEQVSVNNKNTLEPKIWKRLKDLESIIENLGIQLEKQHSPLDINDTVLNAYIERTNDLETAGELLNNKVSDLEETLKSLSILVTQKINEIPDIKIVDNWTNSDASRDLYERIDNLEDRNSIVRVNQEDEVKDKDLREVTLGSVMTKLNSWHHTNLKDVLSQCNSRVFDLIYDTLKISTLGELMNYSATELLSYKNFGQISLDSLNRDLTKFSPKGNLEILIGDGDDEQYIDLTLAKDEALERNL